MVQTDMQNRFSAAANKPKEIFPMRNMVNGTRFDLEEVRREAARQKKAAKTKAIVSNVTFVALLAAIAVGCCIGWGEWQRKRERDRAEARAAQEAEDRERAERERAEAERRAADKARREAEKKAAEERRHQEILAREEAKIKVAEIAAATKAAEEAAKKAAAENEERQAALKRYATAAVQAAKLTTDSYITLSDGLDSLVDLSVSEDRWKMLAAAANSSSPLELLDLARDASITNSYSEGDYPEKSVVDTILSCLAKEKFTLVVRIDRYEGPRLALVKANTEEGLSEPQGSRAMKDSRGRTIGWTVPFQYGEDPYLMLMTRASAEKYASEWRRLRSSIKKDSAKLSKESRDGFIAERLKRELPDFASSVRAEIQIPPAKEPEMKEPPKPIRERDPSRTTMRGTSNNMKTLRGPSRR